MTCKKVRWRWVWGEMRGETDKYPETHGMQDINYTFYNCMEITVEVRRCKYPIEDTLQSHVQYL